ncbi:MAG TPA: hypothetical protein VHE59_10515 [Mucilaginibacter sp.]|nr:hypothetical protein [Mucilaginibacter sp.]
MSFKLYSKVTVGKYGFNGGIHECTIKRSVHEIIDTAIIKIPAVARANDVLEIASTLASIAGFNGNPTKSKTGNYPDTSVESSTLWREGDPVNILLGYNGDYRQEFKGFVRRVSPTIPATIECEGYAWQLRYKQISGVWKSIKLKDLLQILIAGTDIALSPYIPDLALTNLSTHHQPNCLTMLEYLKRKCHLVAYFIFNTLYVGIEEGIPGNTVMYRLGWNCIRDNKLKYRVANDTKVLIRVVAGKGKNAKRPITEVGDAGGSIITENIANIGGPVDMKAIANRLLSYKKYTGYEGQISGFLQPYCNPSDTVQLSDVLYKVMGGSYFVDGIEVKFGMEGARRDVHISRALSTPQFIPLQDQNSNN